MVGRYHVVSQILFCFRICLAFFHGFTADRAVLLRHGKFCVGNSQTHVSADHQHHTTSCTCLLGCLAERQKDPSVGTP
jgi:hypothetical protein